MELTARQFPELYSLFALEYATPSVLHFRDREMISTILSKCGSRQGSASGAAFFCLALHPVLRELVSKHPNVTCLAYMDDITLLAPSSAEAADAIDTLNIAASRVGLQMNARKCEWLSVSSAPPPRGRVCTSFNSVSCIKVLGAQLACNDSAEAQQLFAALSPKSAPFFRRLALLHDGSAAALLSVCGIPKLNHALRTHHPEVSRKIALLFDTRVESTWATWASIEPSDVTRGIASLPLTAGGLGFTRQEFVADSAWTASRNSALRLNGGRPRAMHPRNFVEHIRFPRLILGI